jgi:hypothetical protein
LEKGTRAESEVTAGQESMDDDNRQRDSPDSPGSLRNPPLDAGPATSSDQMGSASHHRIRQCVTCNEVKFIHARGRCPRCYMKERRIRQCIDCGRNKLINGHGRCAGCYSRNKREAYRAAGKCTECGDPLGDGGNSRCRRCLDRGSERKRETKERNIRQCVDCGRNKLINAHGRCVGCYARNRRAVHKAAGKCTECGGALGDTGIARCRRCLDRESERKREKKVARQGRAKGRSQSP